MKRCPVLTRLGLLTGLALTAACTAFVPDPGEAGPPPAPTATQFANPLLAAADPFVAFRDGFYYYIQAVKEGNGGRITLRKTARMAALGTAAPVTVWTAPVEGANSRNIWAPEIHLIADKWYIYFAAGPGGLGDQRTYVLENASPDPTQGTWTPRGRLLVAGSDDRFAIDATVLQLAGGRRYLLWSGQDSTSVLNTQVYIAELANPWTLTGRRVQLTRPEFPWEKIGAPLPLINEGPQALTHGGRVFVTYSASGCWTDDYCLGLLSLAPNADPLVAANWTKSATPVFSRSDAGRAYGPGHNGFFTSRDGTQNWIIYHANSRPGQGCEEARNVRMQPFGWNADGSPAFGQPAPINTLLPVPGGE